jgi:hypothetical protein
MENKILCIDFSKGLNDTCGGRTFEKHGNLQIIQKGGTFKGDVQPEGGIACPSVENVIDGSSSNYVEIDKEIFNNLDKFAISFWFKPYSFPPSDEDMSLFTNYTCHYQVIFYIGLSCKKFINFQYWYRFYLRPSQTNRHLNETG